MLLNIIKYLLLGFIQGFTEPIPVSSSGHLLIFKSLLDKNLNIDFEILATITNFGSLIAIAWLFRNEIVDLFKSFFGYLKTKEKKYYNNYKYCWLIVVGTIPAGIMGLVVTKLGLFDFLEENVKFVGFTLLVTALFLFLIRNINGKKEKNDLTLIDAITIGLFQVIALIPGISRSGATIVGGMSRNLTRETAFNYSFILYIPISIATSILGIKDLFTSSINGELLICYFIALVISAIVTYYATKWFRDIVKKGKLIYFVLYCLVVGGLVIIFL